MGENEWRREKGGVEWAYPGYPVGRLGAGTLSCWPARVELADSDSTTISFGFQGLGCRDKLSEPFGGVGGEHLRMKDSRVLKEGRVTGLEGRGSKGASWTSVS